MHTLSALLVCAALSIAGPTAAQDSVAVPPAPQTPQGWPVHIGADTLLYVYARVGSFTPAERAAAIATRLRRMSADPFFRVDSLRVVALDGGTDIVAGDVIVMTVTDGDAAAAAVPRDELARRYAAAMAGLLRETSVSARVRTIAIGALLALLTAIATILIFRLVQRLFGRALAAAAAGRETWTFSLRIQKQILLPARRVADVTLWLLSVLRVLVLAVLLYVTIPLILSFFPWTRGYAQRLFGYILTPFASVGGALIAFVPNLFTIGAIIVVTWYLLKLIRLVFVGIARGNLHFSGFYPEWAIPTYKLVRVLVFAFALVMVWPYLPGSDSPAFRGVGVIFGLLISFGSASAISNAVGGVVLTYMRPFRVGDRVRIADTEGDVIDKDLLATRVRTIKNVDITIPNAMVLSSHITNYSAIAADKGLILHTSVTIGYDAPWRQVHELLIRAARDTAGILEQPAPFVLQTALNDFYVSYELNAHTDQPNRMAIVYSALHGNILDSFNRAGVEIMSPHYRAVRDGNTITIPEDSATAQPPSPGRH